MNQWIVMGRLTRDPEVRYTNGAEPMAIAEFGLAVDRRTKDANADFFKITAFGKLGEFAEKYLTKGTKILVLARVENNNYIRQDGSKAYGFRFIAESIDFAEAKNHGNGQNSGDAGADPRQESGNGWMNVPETDGDDVPFR